MSAGKRRNRIEIHIDHPLTEGGQRVPIFTFAYKRWAKVIAVSGREGQQGYLQITADVTHLIELDWDEETDCIRPDTHQVKFGDRVLGIVRAYDPDNGMRKRIEIQAIERVAGA